MTATDTHAMSLRARLVLTVSLVAIVAIVVVDVTTYRVLRSSLLDRLDRQVQQVVVQPPPGEGGDGGGGGAPPPRDGQPPARARAVPAGTWSGVYRDPTFEETLAEQVAGVPEGTIDDRDRPDLTLDAARTSSFVGGTPVTLPAIEGDGRFRVAARRLRGEEVLVVALPMDDVDATLARLRNIELVVSILAALGVVALAFITVRAGLRPLESIADAADDIAHDGARDGIGRRVPTSREQPSEGARGAAALNEMLDRIDGSIAAQQATQAQLRQFVADASHELRTPLTSIRGFAELARTRGSQMDDDDRDAALAQVEGEAEHLGRLVEDMLLLSRLDEGLPMRPVDLDIARVAAIAVDAARVVEPARDIQFESTGPVHVQADPVRVRQVVDNLLANVRAHAGAEASVVVHVRATDDGGGEIVVVDTGAGLPPEAFEVATDRFWRGDDARTRATGGSGLGLAIVRSIAQAHGGDVALAPGDDGRGLAVTVRLVGA